MVYLVSADASKLSDDASTIRTLFLVKTDNEVLITKHLQTLSSLRIDPGSVRKLKNLPGVTLEGTSVVTIGSVKPIMALALENSVQEEENTDV